MCKNLILFFCDNNDLVWLDTDPQSFMTTTFLSSSFFLLFSIFNHHFQHLTDLVIRLRHHFLLLQTLPIMHFPLLHWWLNRSKNRKRIIKFDKYIVVVTPFRKYGAGASRWNSHRSSLPHVRFYAFACGWEGCARRSGFRSSIRNLDLLTSDDKPLCHCTYPVCVLLIRPSSIFYC